MSDNGFTPFDPDAFDQQMAAQIPISERRIADLKRVIAESQAELKIEMKRLYRARRNAR